jgi:hypothetical protein
MTQVLGFVIDYCIDGPTQGTSVYVSGAPATRGMGTALLARVEAHARAAGVTCVHIDASLGGVDFSKANGYCEVAPGRRRQRDPQHGELDGADRPTRCAGPLLG